MNDKVCAILAVSSACAAGSLIGMLAGHLILSFLK